MSSATPVQADFPTPRARREYVLLAAALFLGWFTWSTQAMLSVVMAQDGYEPGYAGLIIGIGILPSLVATLTTGRLMARYRPLALAMIGFACMLVGHLALDWVRATPAALIPFRLVQGFGQGMAVTAMMVSAQRRINERRMVYFFGIFTSMLSLPSVLAPATAELYLELVGTRGLFTATAIPLIVAIILLLGPMRAESPPPPRAAAGPGYLALVTYPGSRLIHAMTLTAGVLWGFAPAFMALLLLQRDLPAWSFFTVMTLALFGSRFGLLAGVHALPRHMVVAGGFVLYGLAYGLLWLSPSLVSTMAAALVFGLGHSVAFPVLSVWASMRLPAHQRGGAVALAQLLFSGGSGTAPLLGGVVIQHFGVGAILVMMAFLPAILAIAVAVRKPPGG